MSVYPKITVVTPSYNSKKTIEETIKSVVYQGYPNLEYIIIDGGGDDSFRIIQKYEKHLAHWVSEPDEGQYHAIEKGYSLGSGKILYSINADDIMLPGSLFVAAEIFSKFDGVDWLSTLRPGRWDASGRLSGIGALPGFSREAFLDGFFLPGTRSCGHWIQYESTFFKSSLWRKIGAKFPTHGLAGDFALWCEMYKHADLYGCGYPLAGFRFVSGQRSEAMNQYLKEGKAALDQLRRDLGWSPYRIRSVLGGMRLKKYSKVGEGVAKAIGYRGNRIVNRDPRSLPPQWEIETYRWLP
ncbi:glycosyltransferase family 2 protein [Oricola nitratireducens]|uniref:glycosyltransferase family 2 protein n=1 Tax=Oricola nitratireducens TaxID=2775868 RepID=UPI001866535B|nr:glycosyltransferase family 2 protein [Oricola nitratireducens]